MTLSVRDRWILLLLPALSILFCYFFYVGNPLRKKVESLQKKVASYGADADGLRIRIKQTERSVEEAEARRDTFIERRVKEEAELGDKRRWDLSQSAEARFQQVAQQLEAAKLQLLSARRVEKDLPAMGVFTRALTGFAQWTLHVRGAFPQFHAFLSATAESGWGVPLTVRLLPASEPCNAAEWEMTILL